MRLFVFVVFACAFLPGTVFAGPVLRSGEQVTVGQDQEVAGDLYAMGGAISISGAVDGDAYLTGGTATINAPVLADLTVLGGTVQLHAPVSDDVRIVGGEVTLADSVEGDVLMIGGVLRVLSTASVKGDVLFFGGELVIDGPVEGSVFGTAERARIDASIGGDIEMRAERGLTLGDRAEVLGNITYHGGTDIIRSQNAVVVGDIQENKTAGEKTSLESILIPPVITLFAALTAYLLARRPVVQFVSAHRSISRHGIHGLIGLAVFVGVPLTALVLLVSVLGSYVGVFLLAAYIALLVAAWILTTIFVGIFFMQLLQRQSEVSVLSITAGVVILHAIILIPFLGPLMAFAATLISLGALSTHLYRVLS